MDDKLDKLKLELDELSDGERLELFSFYCRECGCEHPEGGYCQCWNDE